MGNNFISDCLILNEDDYTLYSKRLRVRHGLAGNAIPDSLEARPGDAEPVQDQIVRAAIESGVDAAGPSLSFSGTLKNPATSEQIPDARLLAASCFKGKWWSVTVRSNKRASKRRSDWLPWRKSKYVASADYLGNNSLFSIREICACLTGLLFPDKQLRKPGAVIVTGATASCKSLVTRGLIDEHMRWCVRGRPKRKPHLVTIEDPIEKLFFQPSQVALAKNKFPELPIDYTPRELPTDVSTVSQALKDALRQSPSAVYISEIREDEGWRDLMEFAGTGHLIFATGHAGSVTEAMGKILKAHQAKTPADRAAIAERILGLIHIRLETLGPKNSSVLTVTLWRREGAGKQSFISDGLSALAPQGGDEREIASFGRHWFADRLLSTKCTNAHIVELRKQLREAVLHKTRTLDLEGR